jgi:lipopolysaccharide transport system ATP-binding protein
MLYGMQDLARNMLGMREGATLPSEGGGLNYPPSPVLALRKDEFWALNDINFSIKRGECLGLIGQNGSGKSTLLRLLTGIFPPDSGEITVRGRTGALISLGAGFHPHMTGRENIYLNAAILGLSRDEINQRFNDIVEFAELGTFIDAPVSTYSSGMHVKLGFSIAIHVKPDLLLIDEVLAVGDMGFKIKCINALRNLMAGTAVIFVSHNMQFVSQFCTRILVMDFGRVICDTPEIGVGVDCYLTVFPVTKAVAGTGSVRIEKVKLVSGDQGWGGDEEGQIDQNAEVRVSFDVISNSNHPERVRMSVAVMDQSQDTIILCLQRKGGLVEEASLLDGRVHVECPLGQMDLNAGKYSLVITVADSVSDVCFTRVEGVGRFRIRADRTHWGRVVRDVAWSVSST